MEKYLIVNADDFGITEGVNQAIVEAHHAGVVSSATIMTNMPGFLGAISWANRLPRLGVGLHFTLTYGVPLSPPSTVPSLVSHDGRFLKIHEERDWQEEDVERELLAQWKRFTRTGRIPDHLDSHHGISVNEVVYRPMNRLARKMNLPMRRVYPDSMKAQHPPTTDRFISDVYFEGNGPERLRKHIESLQPGFTELNCHPGYVDETLKSISSWTDVREVELQAITSKEVIKTIRRTGVKLIHYGDLMRLRAR